MKNTESKVAVVSGANRGLGLGASKALVEKGYEVVMLGRDLGKAQKAAKEAGAKGPGKAVAFQVDVTDEKEIRALAAMIAETYGKLDVLINNAGVFSESVSDGDVPSSSVFDVKPEIVLKTIDTNTMGPLRLTQALIPFLKKAPSARVVNVSSGMGQLSEMNGGYPGYRLSKTALNALTRILADELSGTKVKVNSICPGWVKTDMGGEGAERTIEQAVPGIVWAATLPENGPTGGFFRDCEPIDW